MAKKKGRAKRKGKGKGKAKGKKKATPSALVEQATEAKVADEGSRTTEEIVIDKIRRWYPFSLSLRDVGETLGPVEKCAPVGFALTMHHQHVERVFDAVASSDLELLQDLIMNEHDRELVAAGDYTNTHPNSLVDFSCGWTALHEACHSKSIDCLEFLLELAPSLIYGRDHRGQVPHHIACMNGHYQCLKLLLKWEANLAPQRRKDAPKATKICDNMANTLLHQIAVGASKVEACAGHVECAAHLIRLGADIQALNVNMKIPLDLACQAPPGVSRILQGPPRLQRHSCTVGVQ